VLRVDDLVTAMSSLPGFTATDPTEVSVSGFIGMQFELRATTAPACAMDDHGLGTWSTGEYINGVGPGEVDLVRIIDVEGLSRPEIERILELAVQMREARATRRHRSMLESAQIAP
jgi:hypothetical protein